MSGWPDAVNVIDYDKGWTQWGDMIRFSPAPFHRRRLILELAGEVSFDSAVDVGCGNAELLAALGRRRPGARLVGVDLAEAIIAENRVHLPTMEFRQLDIGAAFLPEKFDLVVCSEVVEHVDDWRQAIWHLRQMCGRHLILTVPSGRVFPIDRMMGHHRHFAAGTLTQALREVGLEPERVWRWGFPFHTIYKRLINLSPAASMQRFSTGAYSARDRALAGLIRRLFYLNVRCAGSQIVVRARSV